MKMKFIFYFMNSPEPSLVELQHEGVQHFTADVRLWRPDDIEIVISGRTASGPMYNDEEINRWLTAGVMTKKEVECEYEVYLDHLTAFVIQRTHLKDIL